MCRTFQEMIEWFYSLKVINTKGKNITAQIKYKKGWRLLFL